MHFFGSNPELKPPGGSLDMIFYFRYDSDPNIAMQASKIMCYIREASFIVVGCISDLNVICAQSSGPKTAFGLPISP